MVEGHSESSPLIGGYHVLPVAGLLQRTYLSVGIPEVFKQVNGKARPLWLGSKLGGVLEDFRYTDGKIRALEKAGDGQYVVADYKWGGFGMAFDHYIIKGVNKETAIKTFDR